MTESVRYRILDNSAVLSFFSRLARGSLFLQYVHNLFAFMRRIEERSVSIIEGSRCLAFFKVGDYLEADSSKLLAAVRSADTFRWSSRILLSLRDRLVAGLRGTLPSNSAVSSLIESLGNHRHGLLAPRNRLIFVSIFLATFYALRLLLVTLFSEAEYYLTWSSGLILALLLLGLLTNLAPEKAEESGNDSPAGVLEKTGTAIRRAFKLARAAGIVDLRAFPYF
ncbi:MAG: hypothetical protein A3F83_16405 [Candidatus Glassbacteria bacterium RIFCSPLOWO2_12_FULL_58_11]|uniref:Uncharacterized protein n=1 Tax=Candidatus Glassbacteria bacterium RIFCSPLOWO2_12_FULL_58_11 TaxID=1817867 RepID=A0A1F5YLZ8_9BACT|nr:MAG: hypothetical protein A3F83_16405 [Candidatus Glassbacteria bacterium RIFCSPLOWO2_12_FULL_58_11]